MRGSSEVFIWLCTCSSNPAVVWVLREAGSARQALAELEAYVAANRIPINALHAKGFPSIGCQPCTRAVKPGEDIRAGRWWWENPDSKECGLHVVDGKLIRIKQVS